MDESKLNIEILIDKLSKRILTTIEVSNILNNPINFPTTLIENLALTTATKYYNNEITYEDGDCIMNNVYAFWWTNEWYVGSFTFSETAWECYEAFDAGEYYRIEDDKEVDLAEKYTKPLIEEMLKKRDLI